MYGIINRSIQQYIVEKHSEQKWLEIQAHAGINEDYFVAMKQYPDEQTVTLVKASAEILQISFDEMLEKIGFYWVGYNAKNEYKAYFEAAGNDMIGMLQNLNHMHDQVKMVLPELQPPKFEFEKLSDDHCHLHYRSHREGLSPMVIGLLYGLADWFSVSVEVSQIKFKAQGDDHDVFSIKV